MMKRIKQKGFTLIELLVTIVLLGVVGGVIIYNMTGLSTNSKEKEYEKMTASVISAAATYADLHKEVTDQLYVDKAFVYIKTGDLIQGGFLSEKLVNPYTNEYISMEEKIKASLDSTTGAVIFEYPVLDAGEKKETFMTALSDYVVEGEPFNCMEGVGTYELALANEDGTLITQSPDGSNILDYYKNTFGLQCNVPDNFRKLDSDTFSKYIKNNAKVSLDNMNEELNKIKNGDYYWVTKTATGEEFVPGNYEIEYTWVSETGIKKKYTRTLRVLATAEAQLKFVNYDEYNSKYKGNNISDPSKVAVQELRWDTENNLYDPLKYQVSIDGADTTTTFDVSTSSCGKAGQSCKDKYSAYSVVGGTQADTYVVDDGIKEYKFDFRVRGHHMTNYSYSASTVYTLGTIYKPNSSFISTTRTVKNADGSTRVLAFEDGDKPLYKDNDGNYVGLWATNREAVVSGVEISQGTLSRKYDTVKDTFTNKLYSPTGISKIIYGGISNKNDIPQETSYMENGTYRNSHEFNNIVNGNISVIVNAFKESNAVRWPYIKIKTVNNNGFESEWSDAIPIYVSNYLNDVVSSGCNNGHSCDSVKQLTTKDSVGCSTKHGSNFGKFKTTTYSVRNTDPNYGYVKFDGRGSFIVSSTAAEGGRTIIVDSSHTGSYASGNIVVSQSWGVQTCNGWYSTTYQYVNVNYEDDKAMANSRCSSLAPINEEPDYFCSIAAGYVGYVFSSKAVELGPVAADSQCLWDDKSYTTTGSSSISHGNTWTRNYTNNYQYSFIYNGKSAVHHNDYTNCSTKCYLAISPAIYLTNGDGTKDNPFVIAK